MKHSRSKNLDVLRGLAIVLMAVFHFGYYLSRAGLYEFSFQDPKWIALRFLVLLLFLSLIGVSLALQSKRGFNWRKFTLR